MAANKYVPTELKLHKESRILEVAFDSGDKYELPCELLRVYSPSAEVQGHGPGQEVLQKGKEKVNIDGIEPVGNYAVCLRFDDGHDTGIYSWDFLHDLGENKDKKFETYLSKLEQAGYKRKA